MRRPLTFTHMKRLTEQIETLRTLRRDPARTDAEKSALDAAIYALEQKAGLK